MDARQIIAAFGGVSNVMRITGVTRSRVSHFAVRNEIPHHYVRLFIALRPELNWVDLLGNEYPHYGAILHDAGIEKMRMQRLRELKSTAKAIAVAHQYE
ncbi:hypothetical protein ACS7SF_02755 [Ralstonia sp. 25C]|uniref:hypothetical protein n=1 Tax=Ralstonia sp. 25C TaxID=3447363 RepID=UPI003F755A6C